MVMVDVLALRDDGRNKFRQGWWLAAGRLGLIDRMERYGEGTL